MSGTASAQLVLLLISPILTRLYSAEQFGNFGVFVSIVTILLVLASLKYELALPLIKQASIAKPLFHLCFLLIIVVCSVVGIIVYCFDRVLIEQLNLSLNDTELYLIPLALFVCGSYQLLHFYAIKTGAFKALSISKVVQAIVIAVTQITLSFYSVFGLLLGHIAGFLASSFIFLVQQRSVLKSVPYRACRLLAVAKRYQNFPKFTLWASLANTSSTMMPVVLFSGFYSPALVGLYILAHRMLFAPVTLVGNAVGNVFMSNAKHYLLEGNLALKTQDIHTRLILLAMPIMAVTWPFLPEIFLLVFGDGWYAAGEIAQYIAIWIYFVFTASPISTVLVAMEKQKLAAGFDFIACIIRVGSVFALSFLPFEHAIMFFSLINAVVVCAFITLVFSQLQISFINTFKYHIKAFVLLGIPSFIINSLLVTDNLLVGFLVTVLVIFPVALLLFRKKI